MPMPGISCMGLAGSRGRVSSLSVHATFSKTTTTGSTVALPSLIAGDIILVADRRSVASGSSTTAPSGYTLIANSSSGAASDNLFYKVADGSETSITAPGTLNWTLFAGIILRGNIAAISAALNDVDSERTASAPTNQVKNASGADTPLVVVAGYMNDQGLAITTRGMSPAADQEVSGGISMYIKVKIYNTSPADVTVSMSDDGAANVLISAYLTVT